MTSMSGPITSMMAAAGRGAVVAAVVIAGFWGFGASPDDPCDGRQNAEEQCGEPATPEPTSAPAD